MKYLDYETYKANALKVGGTNWKAYKGRWHYYKWAIETAESLKPGRVLEIGPLGNQVVSGSDTMDFHKAWMYPGKSAMYLWDIRDLPWPIKDKEYDLLIALRVWQHLGDKQEACFREAKRVAKDVMLAVPVTYKNDSGITIEQFTDWNNGVSPDIYKLAGNTGMYLWRG